ncbi:TonB-dependent receptor plug domain-containing protein [Polluticaenibacter yanchengensis]|uniref:TonB-dependent receptor plug domain-containing protein n=1 Tax=Polluticaenibacter yanchengensis TaxID=3014562 RepID=A0ABT4UIW1_9BACT|nr:hypothetical protein [Chitinophagaceae bacterium LY-5]
MKHIKLLIVCFLIIAKSLVAQSGFSSERVFVHISSNELVNGDILWYKVYLFNDKDFKFSELSKVVYIDIVGKDGSVVNQKLKVNADGVAKGSVIIPKNTPTGNYKLIAYTNWMKNFSETKFFDSEINIVNVSEVKDENAESNINPQNIVIIPESGALNSGITSKVLVYLKGINNRKDAIDYVIVKNSGDTVHAGQFRNMTGNFYLLPEANTVYTLKINASKDKKIEKTFSINDFSGVAISVVPENNLFKYKVGFPQPSSMDQYKIVLQNANTVTNSVEVPAMRNEFDYSIQKSDLKPGLNIISVIDQKLNQVIAERFYYNDMPDNKKSVKLNIAETYGKKSEILTTLNNISNVLDSASFQGSVGISLASGKQQKSMDFFKNVEYNFGNITNFSAFDDAKSQNNLDDWLVLNTTSRIKVKDQPITVSYPAEVFDHILHVKAKDTKNAAIDPNIGVVLSVPTNYFSAYFEKTGKNGDLYFPVRDLYGPSEMFLQPRFKELLKTDLNFEVQSPFLEKYKYLNLQTPYNYDKEKLEYKFNNVQFSSNFWEDSLKKFVIPSFRDTLRFYGIPEVSYNLDAYNRFSTVEETLREYVREVTVVSKNGKLVPNVFNKGFNSLVSSNLLIMLDGVPLNNHSAIFDYSPYFISSIDIIPNVFIWGGTNYEAVVNFITYDKVFDGYEIEPEYKAIDYKGLEIERTFFHIDHSIATKDVIPDFRTTLYWNPDFKPNDLIRFFTSDVKGDFTIQIEGVDKNGNILSHKQKFTVK